MAVIAAAARLRTLPPRGAKTVGILTTPEGEAIDEPIWSGVQGPARGAPGLKTTDRRMPWHQMVTALHHVEGHAAAIMRRPGGPTHAVLVLSEQPCDDIPWGCDRILPAILPAGSRLDVYVLDTDGSVRQWKESGYTGTGEGIA